MHFHLIYKTYHHLQAALALKTLSMQCICVKYYISLTYLEIYIYK